MYRPQLPLCSGHIYQGPPANTPENSPSFSDASSAPALPGLPCSHKSPGGEESAGKLAVGRGLVSAVATHDCYVTSGQVLHLSGLSLPYLNMNKVELCFHWDLSRERHHTLITLWVQVA